VYIILYIYTRTGVRTKARYVGRFVFVPCLAVPVNTTSHARRKSLPTELSTDERCTFVEKRFWRCAKNVIVGARSRTAAERIRKIAGADNSERRRVRVRDGTNDECFPRTRNAAGESGTRVVADE